MGTISHDALIVTAHDQYMEKAHAAAVAIAQEMTDDETHPHPAEWTRLISPVMTGVMNGYQFFFVAPDGSKEWWDHSDRGDELRRRIEEEITDATIVKVKWGELGDGIEVVSKWGRP